MLNPRWHVLAAAAVSCLAQLAAPLLAEYDRLAGWHIQPIGRISTRDAISPLDPKEVDAWGKVTRSDPTAIVDGAGNRLEFVRKNLGTGFVVTARGRKPLRLWTSGLENCGELSLSPNGRWVAFICEANGVFVTNLERAIRGR